MKHRFLASLLVLPLLSSFFMLPGQVGAVGCNYGSTQARVQKDMSDPWKREVTITKGQSFNVGGFHNGTGQFDNDVLIQVSGPGILGFYSEGQQVWPPQTGRYTVFVNTRIQFGPGCSEQAYVNVVEPKTCKYGSTQARVQEDIQHAWAPYIQTTKAKGFNVGSFHDGTGQFANDTKIEVFGGGFNGLATYNGTRVLTSQTGWYHIRVTTNGQSGAGCQEDAWAWVR